MFVSIDNKILAYNIAFSSPQVPAMLSIAHRITGVVMTFGELVN